MASNNNEVEYIEAFVVLGFSDRRFYNVICIDIQENCQIPAKKTFILFTTYVIICSNEFFVLLRGRDMKKYLAIFCVCIITITMCSCASGGDWDTSTNTSEYVHGIDFSVPSTWKEDTDESDDSTEEDSGFYAKVYIKDVEGADDWAVYFCPVVIDLDTSGIPFTDVKDALISSIKKDAQDLKSTQITFGEYKGTQYTYRNEKGFYLTDVMFKTKDGNLADFQAKISSDDHDNGTGEADFQQVINSITEE